MVVIDRNRSELCIKFGQSGAILNRRLVHFHHPERLAEDTCGDETGLARNARLLPLREEKGLSDRRKTFFLSLGLSALAGYETSNRGDKLLPDGATLLDKDCFIYGGALTLELETYLTDRVVLLVNARERMLFGSDIGKFHTQVGMGLKFIIN